ncbi:MAG: ATP-binding protein [Pseudolysinimonas sp.]
MGIAESRFRQVVALAIVVTLVATGAADFTAIVRQAPYLAPWWWYPAITLNLGTVVALLVFALVSVRLLRTVALVYALGGLLVLAAVPFAGALPDDLGSVWPLRMTSTFGIAAALTLRARGVWIYVGVLMVVAFLASWADAGDPLVALNTILVSLTVSVPFALLVLVVVRTGRALDAAATSAVEAARSDAASAAASLERRRIEMLAHDDILYTLRATALGYSTSSLARTSLERLSQVGSTTDGSTPDADVITRLRSITTQLAPEGSFAANGAGRLSPDVADALVEAAGEALRNSVIHARGAVLRVSVDVSPGSARVKIDDDGPGFRPYRLPAGRLGVSRSIVERMGSVPGGSARIRSAPGRGTTVELEWAA